MVCVVAVALDCVDNAALIVLTCIKSANPPAVDKPFIVHYNSSWRLLMPLRHVCFASLKPVEC